MQQRRVDHVKINNNAALHKEKFMLDFTRVRAKEITLSDLTKGLTLADLAALTNEMVNEQLRLIVECTDADVTFTPSDPQANDTFAGKAEEVNIPWTLGHLIVHVTASSEESAFLAAELARGVENHGRSRYETPWESVTTLAQCRARLEESRRMRLATLNVWPDQPNLDNSYEPYPNAGHYNAVRRFVGGLSHDDSHLAQIADVVRQGKAARG